MAQEPTHLQRAVLLRAHLSTADNPLVLTGATALDLMGLPLTGSTGWASELLGDPAPPRGAELAHARERRVHLAWHTQRRRCGLHGVQVSRSYGLDPVRGPNRSLLADPVESLVVVAPMLESWVITAVLDAMLSRPMWPTVPWPGTAFPAAAEDGLTWLAPVRCGVEGIEQRLDRLPPTSRAVRAIRSALRRCAPDTWSPMETLLRLTAVRAGFPPPVMNLRVPTGYGTRYLDAAWSMSMTALEFNGRVHSQDHSTYKDEMHRLESLRDAGWRIRVLVHEDLRVPRRRREWLVWLARQLGGKPNI